VLELKGYNYRYNKLKINQKDGLRMFKGIEYKDIDKIKDEEIIIIDLRSPMEYREATIPGAINLPLFTDEERQIIGWTYVNESVDKAKKLGIEAVSKKLPQLYESIYELDKNKKKLLFFCARGGMRSSSLCALLNSLGVDAIKLSGGYKGYRKYINESLIKANEGITYIVLHGKTGVGKTELLYCLKEKGFDVLDLEGAANHRGSLLGSVGLGEARSQKMFESIVYETLKNRKTNYVFVEAESKRIGNVIIPDYIYKSMSEGRHILVEAELDFRAELLVKEYTKVEKHKDDMLNALKALSKYISENNINRYREMILNNNYNEAAKELMEKYYDPMYTHEIKKYEYDLKIHMENIESSCANIEKWLQCYILKYFGGEHGTGDE
jgi:tRNA 2-selenouridine synthase